MSCVNAAFIESGTCGPSGSEESCQWKIEVIDDVNTLIITGSGEMANYISSFGSSNAPWYNYFQTTSSTIVTKVAIGNSITSIGDLALFGCTSLSTITLANSVTKIGEEAFSSCTSLTSIEIEEGNQCFKVIDSVLFSFDLAELLFYPIGVNQSIYELPNSVTSIGHCAFCLCTLTRINIPNSVTSIGSYAFLGCQSLETITLPNSVTSIGDSAFFLLYIININNYP